MNSKIKIAFVKFGGLASGGTEKYLQTLACKLPKDKFEVDYYYTDAAPLLGNNWKHPETDPDRKKYMEGHNINLIHVRCEARQDSYGPPYKWVGDNFFELFSPDRYDIVQTGRSGYAEYPFTEMNDSLFVDSIHGAGSGGIEKRDNICKTVVLSRTHAKKWVENGGDPMKIEIIPPLIDFPPHKKSTLREQIGVEGDRFIFGMHQGNRDDIFSPTPLGSYSLIESENNMFIMLGGSQKYRHQAEQLGIKNIRFLDFTGDAEKINNFVAGIDLFAHGRRDGEMCSAAIIEALHHGKPVVSCPGLNMGHVEQIDGCGMIASSITEYAVILKKFEMDKDFYRQTALRCKEKYSKMYALDVAIDKYVKIYTDIYEGKNER